MELYHIIVKQILRMLTSPTGTHLSVCDCPSMFIIPQLNYLPNGFTVAKLLFTFPDPERGKRTPRIVHGYGPNGTFLLTCSPADWIWASQEYPRNQLKNFQSPLPTP